MYDKKILTEREFIIFSSILNDKECLEWASYNEVDHNIFQSADINRLMRSFNAVSSDSTVPTVTLLLDQACGTDETDRIRMEGVIKQITENFSPEPLDALKKHILFLTKSQTLASLKEGLLKVVEEINVHNPFEVEEELNKAKVNVENVLYNMTEDTNEVTQMTLAEGVVLVQRTMKESLVSDESDNVSSGYDDLDKALDGGMKKGTFCMVAGRPGMGKTVWMLNSALESSKRGNKILFISIEMSLLQCFQRLVSKISDISGSKIQLPHKMDDEDWEKLQKSCLEIASKSEQNFFVQEITAITVPQLERIIKYYKKKHDIDSVYIDYAQIMLTKDGQEPSDASDFAQISGGLRRASKNHHVSIVVGSQLNRNVEARTDKRPIMADIRNSGAFEQDAALILGLYRDEVYTKEESEKPNTLEVIFLKNRFGANGITIDYTYDLSKQSIIQKSIA